MHEIQEIVKDVRQQGQFDRRALLLYASTLSSLPLLSRSAWANPRPQFSGDPFTLGVASGDPDATSVVLWTRLAPKPLEPGAGMAPGLFVARHSCPVFSADVPRAGNAAGHRGS